MTNERLTLEEMEQKYPDEWLFIVDCEISENTELLSGHVLVHSPSRSDVYAASSRYKGGQPYITQVNFQKGWGIYYNGTNLLQFCRRIDCHPSYGRGY